MRRRSEIVADDTEVRTAARSPLLAEPPPTGIDQVLIDHFTKLGDGADWWVALKLTGADATKENAKAVCRELMKRMHPDRSAKLELPKAKVDAVNQAFHKLNHFRGKIAQQPYSYSPAHASGIRPVPAKPPRTATAAGTGQDVTAKAGASRIGC